MAAAAGPAINDPSSTSPAGFAQAVDISGTDHTFTRPTRALYVGGAGDVIVKMSEFNTTGAGTVTFTAVPAGTVLPISINAVVRTSTTATAMVGLW